MRPRNPHDVSDPVTDYAKSVLSGRIVAGPHVRNACRRHLADMEYGQSRGLYWDLEAADHALGFFPSVLRLSSGQFEGRPFELQPSQKFKIGSVFGWKRADGSRRFRRAYIEESKGSGKALALNTPIPTPSGWTTMGRLRIGDQVFDETGAIRNVVGAFDVMHGHPCYRVSFSDGTSIVADAEHLWVTTALRSPGRKGPKPPDEPRAGRPAIRTTVEIAQTLRMPASSSRHPQAKWNHRVDVAGALSTPRCDLPISPYVLGCWLGDGNSDDARMTVGREDWQIVEEIRAEGVQVAEQRTTGGRAPRVALGTHVDSLRPKLKALHLLGAKHIPLVYLRASRQQRSDLLQGLMDTDGHITKNGECELSLCNYRLAADALELIRSLGIKARIRMSDACLYGRVVGERYRIHFWSTVPVFRLPRKQARQKSPPKTRPLSQGRMIVGCEPVESVPVRCIAVDSPSRLFLAGKGMVPTHNTPEAAGVGLYCLVADGEARAEVYAAASTKIQANILFRDANAMREQSPRLTRRLTPTGINPVVNLYDVDTHSFFRPIASENIGQSGPRPSCALCDELHEHRDRFVVDMLERGFKWRRNPLIWMTTNAGTDRNSICWEEHKHAVAVAAGDKEDDRTFAYVCGLDEGDDPLQDPSCWVKANPLLGVTVTKEYLADVAAQARSIPGKANNILRLHFCTWTDAERAWLPRATLEKCVVDFDPAEHAGKDLWTGLDLSASQDITALGYTVQTGEVEVERINPDGSRTALLAPTFDLWAEGWTPGDTLEERAIRDSAPYEVWVREGWLHAPPGRLIRFDYPAARLAQMASTFRIRRLAYDRYAYNRFEDELDHLGLRLPVIEHPQGGKKRASLPEDEVRELKLSRQSVPRGLWMPGSVAALENLLLENRIRIQNNPALLSSFMSAIFEEDPFGNRWFSKRRATNRIDLLIAGAMAIGAADAHLVTSKVDISALVA